MKRLAAVCFSRKGAELLARLPERIEDWEIARFTCRRLWESGLNEQGFACYGDSLSQWAKQEFSKSGGLLFVGACGIAVRAVAPVVCRKDSDPAVVVVDEQGQFSIPILSGHLGGANRLACLLAQRLGAQAVLTTATDRSGKWSVDQWASEHRCAVASLSAAKQFAAALLEQGTAGFLSRFPVDGSLPEELTEQGTVGAVVTLDQRDFPFPTTVQLFPKIVVLGIGCRKGISQQEISDGVDRALERFGIPAAAVCRLATIDRKAQEPGLVEFSQIRGWPLESYSAGQLLEVPGEFSASEFVRRTVGVDNVCERAAVLASKGALRMPKQAAGGVTVAAAAEPYRVRLEPEQKGESQ